MSSGSADSDKRKNARVSVTARVDYEIESEDTFLFEYMTNLSRGGIFLATRSPLEVGTVTKLRFTLPDDGRTIEVTGRVTWVNPYRPRGKNLNPGMGIEFMDLDEGDKDAVTKLVKKKAILPE